MTSAVQTEPVAQSRAGLRRVLVTLCVTETTSWGILYYAFPVLAGEISADTGWSLTRLTAAFSLGLVVSAVLGIGVGRWLDRHGPRWLMTAGSALAVVGVALAPTFGWFVAAWAVSGVAMSAVLYPPAFAALTRWYGDRRARPDRADPGGRAGQHHLRPDHRRPDLVAGLAPHLPGARGPAGRGHRACAPARTPAPLAATAGSVGLAGPRTPRGATQPCLRHVGGVVRAGVVDLVRGGGEPGAAARRARVRAGDCGSGAGDRWVGQVLGRLGYAPLARRWGVRLRTLVVPATVALTTGMLGLLTWLPALVAVAVLAGMVRGIVTLLQATAVTDRWGARDYGALSGVLAAPLTFTTAVAPFVGAALAVSLDSYATMLIVMAAVGLAAAALSLASVPAPPSARTPDQ